MVAGSSLGGEVTGFELKPIGTQEQVLGSTLIVAMQKSWHSHLQVSSLTLKLEVGQSSTVKEHLGGSTGMTGSGKGVSLSSHILSASTTELSTHLHPKRGSKVSPGGHIIMH